MYINLICEKYIMEVIQWKYPEPYSCYNYPDYVTLKKQNWGIVNELINKEQFRFICKDSDLIGFFRMQPDKKYILISLGIRPDLCGHGYGKSIVSFIIRNIFQESNLPIRLNVRTFNLRAIKCYEKVGFKIISKFTQSIFGENIEFFQMEIKKQE